MAEQRLSGRAEGRRGGRNNGQCSSSTIDGGLPNERYRSIDGGLPNERYRSSSTIDVRLASGTISVALQQSVSYHQSNPHSHKRAAVQQWSDVARAPPRPYPASFSTAWQTRPRSARLLLTMALLLPATEWFGPVAGSQEPVGAQQAPVVSRRVDSVGGREGIDLLRRARCGPTRGRAVQTTST